MFLLLMGADEGSLSLPNYISGAFCSLSLDLTRGTGGKRLHRENRAESFGI
jgi:hypothetical protein